MRQFFNLEGSLVRYVLGTAALTIVIQLFYDLANAQSVTIAAGVLGLGLVVVVIVMLYWDQWVVRKGGRLEIKQERIEPRKGLIINVSTGNLDLPRRSLERHKETLEHCWFIYSKESQKTMAELLAIVNEDHPNVMVHRSENFRVDPHDIVSSWKVVDRIFDVDIPSVGLGSKDVVVDITGGLKPMSVGVALACSHPDRDMQYIATPRAEDGKPIPGAEAIEIKIETDFIYKHARNAL